MSCSGAIDKRGRITLPREIRRRLGLSPGDRLDFVVEEGQIVLRPSRSATSVFDKCRGALGAFPGGKKHINSWLRMLRDQ
jgi:AbrB family looped-hinge helix DNA binding protein